MILPPPLRAGAYGVIYPDPPWHTVTWSGKGRDRYPDGERLLSSGAGYPTMMLDELKALPVRSWGARDCRLFMWTTDKHLPQAIELGEAWGFTFSSIAFTWVKLTNPKKPRKPCELCGERKQVWHFGCGHWTRKNSEQCLAFLRGNLNRRSASVRQLVIAPVEPKRPGEVLKYSRKPAEVRERIMQLVDGPYLEMFARPPHPPGWDVWGDEVE